MGYPYDVVEAEYRNYNKDTGLDMQTFQKDFMSENGEDIEEIGSDGKRFVKRYKQKGYLLNEDFSKLLQLIRDDDKEEAINDVFDGEVSPPEGLTRIPCDVCGETIYGALVYTRDHLGKNILQICDEFGWGHIDCHEKQDAIKDKKRIDS